MQARTFRAPRRKTERRWRVPPVIRRGDEPFEGLGVLDEVGGAGGLVLWQSLRDTLLWAEVSPEERPALFAPGAEAARTALIARAAPAPELAEPLRALAAMLGDPGATPAAAVALACRGVAAWGEERAFMGTALAFAQAAATADAADAATALEVGMLARRRAELARAETWLRRAVALARQSGDWATYARAFLALGRMSVQRGEHAAAERHLGRAVRAAQRNSLHTVEGQGLHELFLVAAKGGAADPARELARGALAACGEDGATLPPLARDVARWWIAGGLFDRALPVLRAVLPHLHDAPSRLGVHGSIARAAGGEGDREGFRRAWDACWDLLDDATAREAASGALLDVAHGAAGLELWDRAELAARRALEAGPRRSEAGDRAAAEALLDSIRHHRPLDGRPQAQPPAAAAADRRLAAELVRSLRRAAAAGAEGRRAAP